MNTTSDIQASAEFATCEDCADRAFGWSETLDMYLCATCARKRGCTFPTSPVEEFLRRRPSYTREHVEAIAKAVAFENIPFCQVCADWHFGREAHSFEIGEQAFELESDANEVRRLMIDAGERVSLIGFDPNRAKFVFDLLA